MKGRYANACISQSGKARREFPDRRSADAGARSSLLEYGRKMVPYECSECGGWHLCPAARYTPSHHCEPCSKLAYETEKDAIKRKGIREREGAPHLWIYKCPAGEGWHLTSHLWTPPEEGAEAAAPVASGPDEG